jgi:hypothetical protein
MNDRCDRLAARRGPNQDHRHTIGDEDGECVAPRRADKRIGIRRGVQAGFSDISRVGLVHETERTRRDAEFDLQGSPGTSGGIRVAADAWSEVPRVTVSEGNPDAGRYRRCPEEHRLLQEIRNVQVIGASGRVVRLYDCGEVDIEPGVAGNIVAAAVGGVLRP